MDVTTYYLELIFLFSNKLSRRSWSKSACWQRSYFWGEKTRSTRKKLNCKFIKINTSKESYGADYESGRIQTFITKSTKKLMFNEILKIMVEMKLKQNHELKSKTLEYIVNKKLSFYKSDW